MLLLAVARQSPCRCQQCPTLSPPGERWAQWTAAHTSHWQRHLPATPTLQGPELPPCTVSQWPQDWPVPSPLPMLSNPAEPDNHCTPSLPSPPPPPLVNCSGQSKQEGEVQLVSGPWHPDYQIVQLEDRAKGTGQWCCHGGYLEKGWSAGKG